MQLTARSDSDRGAESGFTLVELVVSIAIVGVIVVALTGVVIEYTKTESVTAARYTESNTVQVAAAYWERDVSSVGLRSSTYDAPSHSFPYTSSVDYPYTGGFTGVGCTVPGTGVVALTWGQYDSATSDAPTTIAVTYSVQAVGSGATLRYNLVRTRCTFSSARWTTSSSSVITQNLLSAPSVVCDTTCNSSTLPTIVSMSLTSSDPNNNDGGVHYSATLTGDRRQT